MSFWPPPRTARHRAAVLLAVLLLPATALAGTVVCAGPNGASTPWSPSSDCPRRALKALPTQAATTGGDAVALSACVTLEGVDAMVVAEAAPVPATPQALFLPSPAPVTPALAPALRAAAERGPPLAVQRAIRSVVLRI